MPRDARPRRQARLALRLALLALFLAAPAAASPGMDAALFHDALAPHGKWVIYADLGPVWFPTGVGAEWRPYVDGRWVPTPWGWVFETAEPWGWATYHFGHWLPTLDFGWVWLPGRTWYPSTVVWCGSRDYIGWAPLPPPFFTPPPAFGGGAFLFGGDPFAMLTPYFWTLCPVAHFLRGWGTFYAPAHSFLRCGCLVPISGVAALLPRTAPLAHFFVLASRPGGSFAFGPDFHVLSQQVGVPVMELEGEARSVTPLRVQQLLPPAAVVDKYPHIREVVPEALLQGQPLAVAPVTDPQAAAGTFLKADVAPRLTRLPALPPDLPRAVTVPFASRKGPEALKGVKGAELPAAAVNPRLGPPPPPSPPAPVEPSPPPASGPPGELAAPAPAALHFRPESPPVSREAPEAREEPASLKRHAFPGPGPEARRGPRMIVVSPGQVGPVPGREESPPAGVGIPRVREPALPSPPAVAPARPAVIPPPARRQEGQVRWELGVREQREQQLRLELKRQRRTVAPAAPSAIRERPTPVPGPLRPAPGPEPGGRPGPPGGFPTGLSPGK